MPKLIRKITRAKWQISTLNTDLPHSSDGVRAEAINACIKTEKDTLSVWYAEDDVSLKNSLTALFCTMDKPDRIDVITFDTKQIKGKIPIAVTDGKTHATGFKSLHRDLIELNLNRLIVITETILSALKTEKEFTRYNRTKVIDHVVAEIKEGNVQLSELPEKWHSPISQKL
jgi:hypothetical protein